MNKPEQSPAYEAAHQAAVYFPLTNSGYLEIHGEDRIDFLQRQTTNDLSLLTADRSLNNVLTSATARVLETFRMLDGGDHIAILVPINRTAGTESFLKSHIFFMDKVEVQNHSGEWSQIEIHGPGAIQSLQGVGVENPPLPDEVLQTALAGIQVRVIGVQGLTTELGYLLISKKEHETALISSLHDGGLLELDQADYQTLRVEAGLPAMGHELTPDYTPLESGIAHWVSDTKGCYTGQEIIARQITYDKVTKALVRLDLEETVELGAKVLADDKNAGTITSVAHSPMLGPIALAVLKKPHNAPGTTVQVASASGRVSGSVSILSGVLQKD